MAEQTGISWADHTWSPWVGCTKLKSPHPSGSACDHCYAAGWAKRTGKPELWEGERRRTTPAYWQQLVKWDRQAAADGVVRSVFPSLCDPFDNQVPTRWRDDMWHAIARCQHLRFLLLTKRPQNISGMLPTERIGAPAWGDGWPNVWLGTTVENQVEADRRIPHLLAVPAAVRFLSCEPLLGPVNLKRLTVGSGWRDALRGRLHTGQAVIAGEPRVNWVICGGESGGNARPMHPDWARELREQCGASGVPFHFKQWGEWAPHKPEAGGDLGGDVCRGTVRIVHPTGQTDVEVAEATGGRSTIPGSRYMARVGTKRAGCTLDGRLHQEFPA